MAGACDAVTRVDRAGKTYSAIQQLKQAATGMYCGPLRLLALEIHETLNNEGVFTNLITGQVCVCLCLCLSA
jgi:hypothetical protein